MDIIIINKGKIVKKMFIIILSFVLMKIKRLILEERSKDKKIKRLKSSFQDWLRFDNIIPYQYVSRIILVKY